MPDHQEVFTSDKTLTSIIFELNERQRPSINDVAPNTNLGALTEDMANDIIAALYHLGDICEATNGDKYEILDKPTPIILEKINVPAYLGQAIIFSKANGERGVNGSSGVSGQNSTVQKSSAKKWKEVSTVNGKSVQRHNSSAFRQFGNHSPVTPLTYQTKKDVNGLSTESSRIAEITSTTTCHFILARLEQYETDMLILVFIPHNEYATTADLRTEEKFAHEMIQRITQTIEIADHSLFG